MFAVGGKEEEVLICLQQEDRRIQRKDGGGENLPIGFEVLKVSSSRKLKKQKNTQSHVLLKAWKSHPSRRPAGGGEPPQPGAVRGGAGGQLRLHGLPQRDAEGHSGPRALRGAAHHLPAGRHWTLPAATLLPFPRQAQVGGTGKSQNATHKPSPPQPLEHAFHLHRELREDLPSPSAFQCFLPQPTVVTTVHLRRASGLSPPKHTGQSGDRSIDQDSFDPNLIGRVLFLSGRSSRCLRHSAMRGRHHQDASVQRAGKPRVQPQSHLLQEIPRHTHLYRGTHTHTY